VLQIRYCSQQLSCLIGKIKLYVTHLHLNTNTQAISTDALHCVLFTQLWCENSRNDSILLSVNAKSINISWFNEERFVQTLRFIPFDSTDVLFQSFLFYTLISLRFTLPSLIEVFLRIACLQLTQLKWSDIWNDLNYSVKSWRSHLVIWPQYKAIIQGSKQTLRKCSTVQRFGEDNSRLLAVQGRFMGSQQTAPQWTVPRPMVLVLASSSLRHTFLL
jgi:hypothetical protein